MGVGMVGGRGCRTYVVEDEAGFGREGGEGEGPEVGGEGADGVGGVEEGRGEGGDALVKGS